MLLPPSRQPSRHKNLWGNFNRKCDSRVKMICYCHGLLTFLALIYIPIWLLNRTTLINIAGSSENLLKYFIMLVHSFAIKVSSRPLQRWDNTRCGTTMTSEVKTTSWPELPGTSISFQHNQLGQSTLQLSNVYYYFSMPNQQYYNIRSSDILTYYCTTHCTCSVKTTTGIPSVCNSKLGDMTKQRDKNCQSSRADVKPSSYSSATEDNGSHFRQVNMSYSH